MQLPESVESVPLEVTAGVEFSYRIHFGRGLFRPENRIFAAALTAAGAPGPSRCLFFLDAGLAAANHDIVQQIIDYCRAHKRVFNLVAPPVILTGGEDAKNSFEVPLKVIRAARAAHLCRHSLIIAVGGGAFIDAVGFAASMIHRGVRLVRFPTTVLAQNDAGIGVKNGVNLRGLKNFLGTFAPPIAVFNDFELLDTLPARDWIAGVAEAFKVAIIKDIGFLDWLCGNARKLQALDRDTMEYLIRHTAALHATHIASSGDPFEEGSARPLDFGHWAAHKLETLTMNELRHGEAVAIGMAIDLLYASKTGYITALAAHDVICAMRLCGLPVWHEALQDAAGSGQPFIISGIAEFREHLGGELHITLPAPLGCKIEINEINESLLRECLGELARIEHKTAAENACTKSG